MELAGDQPWPRHRLRAHLSRALAGAAVDLDAVADAAELLVRCFGRGGKVLIFGNGGSAACAQHLAGEFVCRMTRIRPPLPAIALTADTALLTAIANDFGFERVFSRQVEALGRPEDVALAISTSGRSPNVLAAVTAARRLGMATVGLAGAAPSPLHQLADVTVAAAADGTGRVQEIHLAVQHALCGSVEAALFESLPDDAADQVPDRVADVAGQGAGA